MDNRIVSKAEFARICGVSKAYISKLIKGGHLTVTGKSINVDIQPNLDFYNSRGKASADNLNPQGAILANGQSAGVTMSPESIVTKGVSTPGADNVNQGGLNFNESVEIKPDGEDTKPKLDIRHRLAQIARLDVETDLKRGALIERALVKRLLLELMSIDKKQLMHIGNDLTAQVLSATNLERLISLVPIDARTDAAMFDINAITSAVSEKIDKAINHVLIQKEKAITDFLIEIKADQINNAN